MKSASSCLLVFVLLLCSFSKSRASTSSSLLKSLQQTSKVSTSASAASAASGGLRIPFLKRQLSVSLVSSVPVKVGTQLTQVTKHGQAALGWTVPRQSITATSTSTSSTGFTQFSQRATRLQTRLQRSFSLRAIFSDVITNHPGSASASTSASTSTSTYGTHLQRIATGTIQESWSGFVGGYTLATSSAIARRLLSYTRPTLASTMHSTTSTAAYLGTSPAASINQVLPYSSILSFSQQTLQMHSQSLQFGIEWAQMSAVFGASRLIVQTIRKKDDEWNTVVGSALAGSVFACLPKPTKPLHGLNPISRAIPFGAMTRGAMLYGCTMFLLHPTLWKDGMHKAMLLPPTTPPSTASTTTSQPEPPITLTANRFRNQPMQWWDGGIQ
ncbi:expressed unknown protein [Seminavis robusta]|uniref:Uncharacterized protein n=1 Tax=Seminavis robusta TaxID=568900 RepID=A0A9N8DNN3_9STRA|nr:expressed unknown protein [Seminavis robusta]|eukprot:Sro183_g079770.1 n/a (385) ;mRNA; f:91353-92507